MSASPTTDTATPIEPLADLLAGRQRPVVLTGAGLSTGSGIPDYRDDAGDWKRRPPMQYREFVGSDLARRRYWARNMLGWTRMRTARPNAGHQALARLEAAGAVDWVITQNVDGLHQRAGSHRVTDLHGRLDRVVCLDCGKRLPRDAVQGFLVEHNPGWGHHEPELAPDGDVDLEMDFRSFRVPDCPCCGGVLKPDVVFFGEKVPVEPVDTAFSRLDDADLLLVAGSSLMVWSGYRFVRRAAAAGIPVAIVNLGRTRGDREASLKIEADCGVALGALADRLGAAAP